MPRYWQREAMRDQFFGIDSGVRALGIKILDNLLSLADEGLRIAARPRSADFPPFALRPKAH
jgi:hypothetical protein